MFRDGQIVFLDAVPVTGPCEVLVTFLGADSKVDIVPKGVRDLVLEFVRESRLGLSPRELEVLTLAQQGLPVKEIASALEISNGTARNYLSSIYRKLKVPNRTQAIKRAVECGLLAPLRGFRESQ